MLQKFSIATRLFAAFSVALLFVILVAAAGQWALTTSVDTAVEVLNVDFVANGAANDTHIAGLDLRRFEKDYFINIGDPAKQADYMTKFNASLQALETHLQVVEK